MRPHVVTWLDQFLPHHISLLVAPTWFTCIGLAGLVTLLLMVRIARRRGIDPALVASAILWSYLAAVAAGIVVPMIIDAIEQYVARGRVRVRWAGMTSFWGYLAGGAALVVVCRRGGLRVARFADLAAAPLGVALVFARLGCFLAGCDFGKVTSSPLALRFPSGSPAWRAHVSGGLVPAERTASLPVHPTQLYEAMLGVVMALVALAIARTPWARRRPGTTFLAVAATYALGRLGVEELRGDVGRGFHLGLSSGQVFSIAVLAAIAIGVVATSRRVRRAGPATAALAAALLALVTPRLAAAQPGTIVPTQPQPPPQPQPQPQSPYPTDGAPISPYPDSTPGPDAPPQPPAQPLVAPVPAPAPAPAPAATATARPRFELGALFGYATVLNRRQGQIPPLAGPSLSAGVALPRGAAVWLDLDSLGNDDASHGTILLSAGLLGAVRPGLTLGARVGAGTTLVNFDEPAFRDVSGATLRAEALVVYDLGERWFIAVRPLTFDLLSADNLGGAIVTWQLRAGLAYRFGPRVQRASAPATARAAPSPARAVASP